MSTRASRWLLFAVMLLTVPVPVFFIVAAVLVPWWAIAFFIFAPGVIASIALAYALVSALLLYGLAAALVYPLRSFQPQTRRLLVIGIVVVMLALPFLPIYGTVFDAFNPPPPLRDFRSVMDGVLDVSAKMRAGTAVSQSRVAPPFRLVVANDGAPIQRLTVSMDGKVVCDAAAPPHTSPCDVNLDHTPKVVRLQWRGFTEDQCFDVFAAGAASAGFRAAPGAQLRIELTRTGVTAALKDSSANILLPVQTCRMN